MRHRIMTLAAMCVLGGTSFAAAQPSVPLVSTKLSSRTRTAAARQARDRFADRDRRRNRCCPCP